MTTPVEPLNGARVGDGVEEGKPTRALLPRVCKKTSKVEREGTLSEKPSEKKPSDYQFAVARHLAESKGCDMAYSDNSFRVFRDCSLSSNPEVMEDLCISFSTEFMCAENLHC